MGSGSVEMLVSSKSARLREALSLLGVFVMGAWRPATLNLAPDWSLLPKMG